MFYLRLLRLALPASKLLLVAGLLLACSSGTRALADFASGTIDFDCSQLAIGDAPYGPGPAAIGSPGDLWNTADITTSAPLSLFDTHGNLTTVVWSIFGSGGVAAPLSGTYAKLVDVSTAVYSATISGLSPNQPYTLYLYSAYWDMVFAVNGVDFTTYGIRYGSVNSLVAGSEYDVHTVTADATGTLSFSSVSAQFGVPYVTSWQLTAVPEPGTCALGALSLVIALLRRSLLK